MTVSYKEQWSCYDIHCVKIFAGLEIHFDELEYSVSEDGTLTKPITVQFKRTQREFVLLLNPVSIDNIKAKFNITDFIDTDSIGEAFRATPRIYV